MATLHAQERTLLPFRPSQEASRRPGSSPRSLVAPHCTRARAGCKATRRERERARPSAHRACHRDRVRVDQRARSSERRTDRHRAQPEKRPQASTPRSEAGGSRRRWRLFLVGPYLRVPGCTTAVGGRLFHLRSCTSALAPPHTPAGPAKGGRKLQGLRDVLYAAAGRWGR